MANAIVVRVSNACAEEFNNPICAMSGLVRGHCNKARFNVSILFLFRYFDWQSFMKIGSKIRRQAKRRGRRHLIVHSFHTQPFPVELLLKGRFFFEWRFVEKTWRPAYEWMTTRLSNFVGAELTNPPIWAWEKFSSRRAQAQAIEELFGGFGGSDCATDCERNLVHVKLKVPRKLALKSSYSVWNIMLSDSLSENADLSQHYLKSLLFSSANLYGDRYTQVVVPYVDPDWIVFVKKHNFRRLRYL
ncbi:DUF3841 domain-containing protein [Burkholderia cepacia]|uniref:DUF3841 domain-containing protein n=1 Tax=Burkholderia cepacia TaxID=292 RepID=UPI000F570A59|nr:DUF3841 domain-containing protein [Burkholderia cepacia]RQT70105.1 DUF3841 domain-containing protein [Burkholderia cepacia]RQT91428.1 DUF3841 domain-containing protein [Burkholderia cepacia]RQZ66751.1 DUF3841 domain-containing protein [Burkholderia cepacia]RQZ89137.1 DUF3841 domain-containing protein [Burkholderia cepacia]RQZ94770.1 DUF3841 domain-containing protein [Burkholderia cepacia]